MMEIDYFFFEVVPGRAPATGLPWVRIQLQYGAKKTQWEGFLHLPPYESEIDYVLRHAGDALKTALREQEAGT